MMKILTVIYVLKYLIQVINGANELYDLEFWKSFDKNKNTEKVGGKALKLLILISLDFIEIPYICIALRYQKNIITIGFIIFWILILAIRQIKKGNVINLNRLTNRIINLIDLSYFIYMFYVLFIK